MLVGVETLVIGWWYAGRYYGTPQLSLYPTLVLAAAAGVAVLAAAILTERARRAG